MRYADVGLAHSFVGNTCPGVYRDPARGKDCLLIGNAGYSGKSPAYRQRPVAGICTDLWWYSIADLDEWKRRMGRDIDPHYDQLVKVRPGVYKFSHQYHLIDDDREDGPQVYAYIDWVREPDPVRDFLGEFNAMDFTAGQVFASKMERYGDLYGEDIDGNKLCRMESCARMASQIFCTIGSGIDWHPNGWGADDPDLRTDSPEIEIPIFDRAFSWYPLSDYSAIQAAIGKTKSSTKPDLLYLNDSFLALGWNIVQSIIRYGSVVESYGGKTEEHIKAEETSNLEYARSWARGLAERWPDRIPEYCRELV